MAKRLNGGRWLRISLVGICLVVSLLSVSETQAGRITYVYDSLNRLTRAVYDKTTFTYTYDKTGNRLTKRATLTKPMGTVDFDGDAKTDIAFWRPSNGYWYVLRSSDQQEVQTQWGTGTLFPDPDVPVPGDYDGDGKTDMAVWRPGDYAYWYILRSSGGVDTVQWGASTLDDKPVPGDYDGDGKTDITIWRPGDGFWHTISSKDGITISQQWGAGYDPYNDKPVPGDYDGDGKTDYAVYRPQDYSLWLIIRSSDGGSTVTQWGEGTLNDVPVAGDYDGDGKTDLAVWRPGEGNWHILPSSNPGAPYTVVLGTDPSDVPITVPPIY